MEKRFFKYLLLLILTSGSVHLYAQKQGQGRIDSILVELRKAKEDTNKVKLLDNLSAGYLFIDPDEGIKYGLQALALATNLGWGNGITDANNKVGSNYFYKSDYPRSLAYYNEGLKSAEAIEYKKGIEMALGGMAIVCYKQSDYNKAMDYNLKALQIAQEIGFKKEVARVTMSIGSIYSDVGNYPGALQSYLDALKIFEEINDKGNIAIATGNIGSVYIFEYNYPKGLEYSLNALKMYEALGNKYGIGGMAEQIGAAYSDMGDPEKGLEYHYKALKIAEETSNKNEIETITGNIGSNYAAEKNYVMAIYSEQVSLKICEEIGDKNGEASALKDIGKAYLDMASDKMQSKVVTTVQETMMSDPQLPPGYVEAIPADKAVRLHKGIDYLQRSLVICKEENALDIMQDCYYWLSRGYRQMGDYKKALECMNNYDAIRDSIFSKGNSNKIAALINNYELDKRQNQISLLEKDKEISAVKIKQEVWQRNSVIVGSVLIIGLLIAAFLIKIQTRTKNLQIAFSRSLIQSQETERQRISRELHDSVGQNILFIKNQLSAQSNDPALAPVMDTISTTIDDVRNISKDLYPNQLEKYGLPAAVDALAEKVTNTTGIFVSADLHEIEGMLWKDANINLYRIIQEALNNTIKHAGAKAVRITGNKVNSKIVLAIMDNGQGFNSDLQERKAQGSSGLLNMEERAKLLNGRLELESAETGTKITITIPVQNEV